MKIYQTSDIRNIALVGGAKAGKTTMAEAMAFCGGLINRRGTVDGKNTISDYRDIELDRKYSVETTLMYTEFGGKKINILDVPGFADYQGELDAALNVVEAAVVVVNAQSGVEVGTERRCACLHCPWQRWYGPSGYQCQHKTIRFRGC